MSEVKDKILTEAELLFMRYGFKSITMDDVAREIGVSKKTLYQFFADKNDLVSQCVEHYLDTMNNICTNVVNNKKLDAIEVIIQISEQMSVIIRQVNPSSMFDLKKYFKPSWDKLEADRKSYIKQTVINNLNFGIKSGLYHNDLDPEIVSRIYIYLIGFLTDPDNYDSAEMDIKTLHLDIVKYHLRSICTPKGLQVLNTNLNSLKK